MKNILILGAGQSAPYMINYLLKQAEVYDWNVILCDRDFELAKSRIAGHPKGKAVEFDVNDEVSRNEQIKSADVVVNFLAPMFQYLIALDCLSHGKHVVTASYENVRVADLHNDAERKGMLILNEMGLDPGIDHMSAMKIIQQVRNNGGYITSFISYGSGLPAPEVQSNPMKYCITWNPRNVALAGEAGAQYMENSAIKLLPHNQVFRRTWRVDVEGLGKFEAYPNRDSLVYQDLFELHRVHTMIRATLRYPGWSETWSQIVQLGMTNDIMKIPNLPDLTFRDFTSMFLPIHSNGSKLETRLANYLGISPTGKIIDNITWLGLLEDKKIGGNVSTPLDVLTNLLIQKMPLPAGARDMVILVHEIEAIYPNQNNRQEKITSTFIEYGEPDGFTAISKTVGLPAAIAAKLLMLGELKLTGCQIPTHPEVYPKVLKELSSLGLKFTEKIEAIN